MSCNRSWSSSVIDVPVSNPSKPPSDVDFATNDDDDDGLVALPLSFKFLTLSFDVVKFLYLLSWMRAPSPEDLPQEEEEEEEEEGIVDADATAHRRDDRDGDAEEDAGVLEGVATTNMIDLIVVDDNTRALLDFFFFDDTQSTQKISLFFFPRRETKKWGRKKHNVLKGSFYDN